jgi:hypothetical protein
MLNEQNAAENSKVAHEKIREAGYDIRVNAEKLLEKYENLIIKNNG